MVPVSAMYQIGRAANGARFTSSPAEQDFRFPTSKVMAYTTAPKTRLIAIANPNNPTGAVASAEDLLLIARSAPQAAVLVDEAYFEFHVESLLVYSAEGRNLVFARPFSNSSVKSNGGGGRFGGASSACHCRRCRPGTFRKHRSKLSLSSLGRVRRQNR